MRLRYNSRDESKARRSEHDLISARRARQRAARRPGILGALCARHLYHRAGGHDPGRTCIRRHAGAAPRRQCWGQWAGAGAGAGATIAVVNSLANTVTVYGAGASGDVSPTATLTLGLDIPDCAAFDAAGDLWVVNYNGRSVVEYSSDAFSGGPKPRSAPSPLIAPAAWTARLAAPLTSRGTFGSPTT